MRSHRVRSSLKLVASAGSALLALGLCALTATQSSDESSQAKRDAAFLARYQGAGLPAPCRPLSVFHLGHSLVGRDMPAMLAQLAPQGHHYASQLGWGTTLKAHWGPQDAINGFATENDHASFEPVREALASGRYDAFVMTEMIDLRDAIRYFESSRYVQKWTQLARKGRPDIRVYLYETWHPLDVAGGWLERLGGDLSELWERQILQPAMSAYPSAPPIYLVPAGQVMKQAVRAMEAGTVPGLSRREALFTRMADGSQDPIHLSDIGAYLVALTHYAVLYGKSPEGLPYRLHRADGSPALAPSEAAARKLQAIVWTVVKGLPETGVTASPPACS